MTHRKKSITERKKFIHPQQLYNKQHIAHQLLCISVQNGRFRSNIGQLSDPKCQVEGIAPTNLSSSQKTRLNGLSYGIKSGQIFLTFYHNADRQTDGWTEFSSLDCVCIACSAVKHMQKVSKSQSLPPCPSPAPHLPPPSSL